MQESATIEADDGEEPRAEKPLREDTQRDEDFANMDAVFDRIGGAGRYNLTVLIVMIFYNVFPGMITLSANFTAASMSFNCTEYGIDNDTMASCSVVESVDSNSDSQCRLTFNCSLTSDGLEGQNTRQLEFTCRGFYFFDEYFQETVVSRFQLVCHRAWMANLATTFYFIGFLLGNSAYGAFADKFGRLTAISVALIHVLVTVLAASQAPYLWLYWTLQFVAGIGSSGLSVCPFSYTLESTNTKHRSVWGFSLPNGWSAGIFLGTLIAYLERRYQRLLLYYGLSVIAALPALLLLSESPRWLVSTGRYRRADAVLHRIARLNGRLLSESFSSKVVISRTQRSSTEPLSQGDGKTILDLLRQPGMRRVTFTMWAIAFSVIMAFYGISLGVGDLGGSIYVNQLILAAVEVPGHMLGILTSRYMSRKASCMIVFALAGSCLAVTAFLVGNDYLTGVRIAFAMMGKLWITLALNLNWMYSAEVFPTLMRSLGVGSVSVWGRTGGMISTLVLGLGFIWRPLPYLILAVGPLVASFLVMLLPETRGRRLPDTLEEAEELAMGLQMDRKSDARKQADRDAQT